VHKERLVPQTYIFGLLSIALWVPALWYFINNLTDWQVRTAIYDLILSSAQYFDTLILLKHFSILNIFCCSSS